MWDKSKTTWAVAIAQLTHHEVQGGGKNPASELTHHEVRGGGKNPSTFGLGIFAPPPPPPHTLNLVVS